MGSAEEEINEELSGIKVEYENLRSQLCKLENLLCKENGGEFGLSTRLQLEASKLFNTDKFSDVQVILKGGTHIKAHKMILAASGDDWGVEQFDHVDMLDLTDLRYDVGYALMHWVYTDDFGGYSIQLDDNFFIEMMQAAKVCKLKALHIRCQKALSTMVNNETCERFLKLSEEFEAKILKENCEKLLKIKSDVLRLHHPKDSDEEIVVTRMDSDNESMDDEDDGCMDENPETLNDLGVDVDAKKNLGKCTKDKGDRQTDKGKNSKQDSLSKKIPKNPITQKKIIKKNEKSPKDCPQVSKEVALSKNRIQKSHESDVQVLISEIHSKTSSVINLMKNNNQPTQLYNTPKLRNLLTFPVENNSVSEAEPKKKKKEPNLKKGDNLSQPESNSEVKIELDIANREDDVKELPVAKKKRKRKKRDPSKNPLPLPKKHICDICGMFFGKLKSVEIHQKSQHFGIALFTCKICGKEFKSESYRYHMERHKASKDLVCHICGKTMSVARDLKRHIQYHNASKKSCTYCDYTSQSKGALEVHIRTHTNERPYTCSKCGKSFKIKSSLDRHKAVHLDEKLFKCDECPWEFKHPYRLDVHKKKKHSIGPRKRAKCELCEVTCCDKSTLKRHYSRKHKNEPIPSESSKQTVIVEDVPSVSDVEVLWM